MVKVKGVCKYCNKEINFQIDEYVLLGTYKGKEPRDESYFHLKCFKKWYNKKVSEKAKNTTSKMQEKVKDLIANPQIAGILGSIKGTDKLKGMLDLDLSNEIPDLKNLIPNEENKNKKDGKRKKRSVESKAQM